jgi:hypothetical protein
MYNGGGIYFADSGDLTHSMQSQAESMRTFSGTVVCKVISSHLYCGYLGRSCIIAFKK